MTDSLLVDGVIELLGGGVPSMLPQCPGVIFTVATPSASSSFTSAAGGSVFDLGTPQPVTDLVASLLLDGERPFGRRASNRLISLPVLLRTPGVQGIAARQLLAAGREALFQIINQDTWTLQWTRDGAPVPLIFDCFRAQPSVVTYDPIIEQRGQVSRVMLNFQALPYGRSPLYQTLNFSSPIVGGTPPPAPVTIDSYSSVSSSTQPTWWSTSSQAVVGTQSAKWDFENTDQDSAPLYTHTLGANVDITGRPTLAFWMGLGSPENYNTWHKGNVTIAVTLTDNAAHTISFGKSVYCFASNSSTVPTWNSISIPIPQGSAGFVYTQVHAYTIQVWRNVDTDNDLEFDGDVYLNGLTASATTAGSPASSRGTVYQLLGIQGSAHTPIALTAQQTPSSTPTIVDFTSPGAISWSPPAGVTSVDVKKWGGGGRGGNRTTSGAGGGGGGGEFNEITSLPCTPGVTINGFVGAGAVSAGGNFIQRVAKGTLNSTTLTTFSGTVSAATSGGQTLIVIVGFGTTARTVSTITDTKSNTYALDYSPGAQSGRCMEVWRCASATALSTSDSITVTLSGAEPNGASFIADLYVPLAAPDATNFVFNAGSTTCAPNVTCTSSDIVAIAATTTFGAGNTPSVNSPFIATGSDANCNTGAAGLDSLNAYKVNPGNISTTATFTFGSSKSNIGVILGYPASGSGVVNGGDTWFGANDVTTAKGGPGVAANTATGAVGGTGSSFPNELTTDSSGFEAGIGGWANKTNSAVVQTAAQAHTGTKSLQMTAQSAATMSASSAGTVLTQGTVCFPGDIMGGSIWFRTLATVRSVQVGIEFHDSTGASLGAATYGSTVSDSTSAWTQAVVTSVTAPANTAFARLCAQVVTPANAEVHYVDDATLFNGYSFAGGAGATGSTTGGGGGESGGPNGVGGAGSGATGGTGHASAGDGGAGGAAGGNNAGGTAAAPGGGGGGGFSTGGSAAGGSGANGQIELSYTITQAPFKTLIAHMPSQYAPNALVPLVQAGNGSDPPDNREYLIPAPAVGVNARFGGTYTLVLTNFTFDTPANARTVTVTIKQYEYTGGSSATVSVARTFTPNTDISNGIIILDNLTLPIKTVPADNNTAYFSVAVNGTNANDRYMDLLFIDTEGQLLLVNVSDSNAYSTYWLDVPAANMDIGLLSGSVFDRSSAVSVLQYAILSGGPLTAEPGNNNLLVYAVEGQPAIGVTYAPRFWVDDPGTT